MTESDRIEAILELANVRLARDVGHDAATLDAIEDRILGRYLKKMEWECVTCGTTFYESEQISPVCSSCGSRVCVDFSLGVDKN